MSAQFFGRSGKVLYGAFSIVGMASQPHNVNKGIPDDRVARSNPRDFEVSSFRLEFRYLFHFYKNDTNLVIISYFFLYNVNVL